MASEIGKLLRVSIFGESHGPAIGCVIHGLPAGEEIDMNEVLAQMARRAPGRDKTATTRQESDTPQIVSGIKDGRTTGAPLAAVISNTNQRSRDYAELQDLPRPGHADYPAHLRYGGHQDVRGGGHFSGRLTAPLVFAGSVCRQILRRKGIVIGAHIYSIGEVADTPFDPVSVDAQLLDRLARSSFALINPAVEQPMRDQVEMARLEADSIGGVIEAAAVGLPGGLGSPMFDGVENRLSAILFGIPAVKGLEFGDGFALCRMRGSQANDPYTVQDGRIVTTSNHNGGILGGITTGMPLLVRVAIKPTSSIGQQQQTVRLSTHQPETLIVHGRHDPCIVPRAVPVVESALAIGLLDLLLERDGYSWT